MLFLLKKFECDIMSIYNKDCEEIKMKKKVIIESTAVEVKSEKVNDKHAGLIDNKVMEWLIYMIGYGVVLLIVSSLFDSFNINKDYFGMYAFLAAIIIYVLNKTVKPIINFFMLPVTAISLGLAYPIVNIIILKITSLILGKENFDISGIFGPFLVVLIISFFNILMEGLVIKPIVGKSDNING